MLEFASTFQYALSYIIQEMECVLVNHLEEQEPTYPYTVHVWDLLIITQFHLSSLLKSV